MAMKLYSDSDIQDIADAIRSKNGSSDTYKVSEMATAISNIPSGGGGTPLDSLYANNGLVYANSFESTDKRFVFTTKNTPAVLKNTTWHSGTYKVYTVSTSVTSADIGTSVLTKLTPHNLQSSPYYFGGPCLCDDTTTGAYRPYPYANAVVYKYNTVSEVNASNKQGTPIVCDGNFNIIAVPSSWSELVTALNNHTIDISNGIMILGNSWASSGSSVSAYSSPYTLNFYA